MKEIQLNHGKVALVDDEDYDRLSRYKWTATKQGQCWYAVRCERGKQKNYVVKQTLLQMHREVLRLSIGDPLVDHINRNGLDNQKHNLRLATRSVNGQNKVRWSGKTSPFLGVCWGTKAQRWIAQIKHDGKNQWLGYFIDPVAAARAYDAAALLYFGPHARVNFPG